MYQKHYSRFLSQNPEQLHFTAHSHHLWPDCTREAHLQYWDDSARLADEKWSHIFGKVIPEAQRGIAEILKLPDSEQITFAPNTHKLVCRLFSCFTQSRPIRVLTTDGEFHSFARQLRRLEECHAVQAVRLPVFPIESLAERLRDAAEKEDYDLIFFSQIFFVSGVGVENLTGLVRGLTSLAKMVVVDGYHGFCAIPTDLSSVADSIFYLSGGYKYAQSGEGVCFLYSPPATQFRPINTGWFASFATLEQLDQQIEYGAGHFRFFGATFDPSGLYRWNAVHRWMREEGLTTAVVHSYVRDLQTLFLEGLERTGAIPVNTLVRRPTAGEGSISTAPSEPHGHFLTFHLKNAGELCHDLSSRGIVTDVRGEFIRFGFGLYQTRENVEQLLSRLSKL